LINPNFCVIPPHPHSTKVFLETNPLKQDWFDENDNAIKSQLPKKQGVHKMEEGPRLHYQEQVLQGLLGLRKA